MYKSTAGFIAFATPDSEQGMAIASHAPGFVNWGRNFFYAFIFNSVWYSCFVNVKLRLKRFHLGRLFLACCVTTAFSLSASHATSFEGREALPLGNNPVDLIDYEIHLLRAELAILHQDFSAFRLHFQRLNDYALPDKFRERFERLQGVYQQSLPVQTRDVTWRDFASASNAQTIVVLLPLSGDYHQAAVALLEPLKQAFERRNLYILDTDLYQDMQVLWQLVKLFDPDLIIGPLEPTKVEAFLPYAEGIPTLLFTATPVNHPYLRSMSSAMITHQTKMAQIFQQMAWDSPLWIHDNSERAIALTEQLQQYYQAQGLPLWLTQQGVTDSLEQTLAQLVGAQSSQARYQWLQRTLQRSLSFMEYSRRDKDVMVAYLGHQRALQLVPLLDYYQQRLPVIWIPPTLPDVKRFRQTLPLWQGTYAILPKHFVQSLVSFQNNEPDLEEVGLFYALGGLAVELIRDASRPLPYVFETELGLVEVKMDGRYEILPQLYRLDKGQIIETDSIELRREQGSALNIEP